MFVAEMYKKSTGACRGGNSPANRAGSVNYKDRNCKDRCDISNTCTGYVLPVDGSEWCETYASVGATGDGRNSFECFMKHTGTSSTST